ncbi:MAG: hypothetical protein IJY71_07100 [Clostridia bacterium]|nr:hypothetical protein [Clostridia bacterium]
MIIFLDAGGNILTASSPEKVGRNSNFATSIYIVAPFVSDTTVYLTFRLPNGEELFGGIAHEEEELPYEDAAQKAAYLFTASGFTVWKYALPESVTLYAGTVQYTVVTLTESMRATATGTFLVSKGNRLVFPDAEPENAWELLTKAVKALENTLYDAGELPPKLGANSLAERVAKAENALEGKLDKITDVAQTGNFGGAYVLNSNGTQGMVKITNTTGSGTLPMRGSGGVVVVGKPIADAHAANKGFVEDTCSKLEKRIYIIEKAAEGNIYDFVTDSSSAYEKAVPSSALPYALLERVGGAVKGGGGFTKILTQNFDIYNENEDLTVDFNANTGAYTFTGLLVNEVYIIIYDINFPEPISAGEYEFYLEGDGTNWSIWNASIEVYNDDLSDMILSQSASYSSDAKIAFTLEQDGRYILNFSTIGTVGQIGTITVTPKLVKKGGAIEKSPVTAIENYGKNLFNEAEITEAANSKGEVDASRGVIENGYLKAKYGKYSGAVLWLPFSVSLEAGNYTVSADVYIGSASPSLSGYMGLGQGNGSTKSAIFYASAYDVWERKSVTVTLTEDGIYYLEAEGGGASTNYRDLDVRFKNIQVEKADTATAFAPYRAPITYEIPQAVRSLKGYGLAINKNRYNYIDFEAQTFVRMVAERDAQEGDATSDTMLTDGTTTLYVLDATETVDISDTLDFDGEIEVEANGAIVAENALKLDIPSAVVYQIKL